MDTFYLFFSRLRAHAASKTNNENNNLSFNPYKSGVLFMGHSLAIRIALDVKPQYADTNFIEKWYEVEKLLPMPLEMKVESSKW